MARKDPYAIAQERIEEARRTEAKVLDLSNLGLMRLPGELGRLPALQQLNLSNNQLTGLPPEVERLQALWALNLSNNQLTGLPPEVERLQALWALNLSNNQLTGLPPEVERLQALGVLSLQDNQLTGLPPEVGCLQGLWALNLQNNRLTSLPAELGRLRALEVLSLQNNQLTSLPAELGRLPALWELLLQNNQLTSLPAELGRLPALQRLSLQNNQLTSLPAELGRLPALWELLLQNNQLTSLPAELGRLRTLRVLYLHGNEQLGVPPEVLGPTFEQAVRDREELANPATILEYYFRIQQETERRPLNEAKLILVGYGAVGKTSLVNRLVYDTFQLGEAQTEGINITQWPLRLHDAEDIRLHVWDFGGQEIMHATHQFFLTQRSLYLLVLNGRQGHEDADAEYWLTLIESFGGEESPVLIVLNKINERRFDVNRRALQQKFPNIRGFVETDCLDGTSIADLRRKIEAETNRLEHLRDAFPASWFSIKDELASMSTNYLTYPEYQAVCTKHQETDSGAQKNLAGYLHVLGVVLNYADDPRLRDTHVLNPHWVTEGVYTILNHQPLADAHGELHLQELSTILDSTAYPEGRHLFLIDLMRKFELCFPFPDEGDHYLIPELLDKQQPPDADAFSPRECLNFQYRYPILPEGLLPRFIVRTHVLNRELPRWKTGVILSFEGNRALVKADLQDKQVSIAITGPVESRQRLLAVIRSDFEHIHRSFTFSPPVQEMVPVPEHPDVLVSYEKLRVLNQAGRDTHTEIIDGQVLDLSVIELLNGVDLEKAEGAVYEKTGGASASAPAGGRHTASDSSRGLRVFISYAHKDETLRNEFDTHLKILQRLGRIEAWSDRQIRAGEKWAEEIDTNLGRADIILLLVSADFLNSDYCYEKEMQRALARHAAGEARVVPIIVRACTWDIAQFAALQALPPGARPVTLWEDRDSAWTAVANGLKDLAEELAQR